VGLTSRAGVVPISHTQDSVGPHGRTVADVAAALSVLQSRTYDGRDPATGSVPLGWTGRSRPTGLPTDYTRFLSADGLRGARIGVTHVGIETVPPLAFAAFEAAVAAIEAAGATVIDLDAAGVQLPYSAGEFLVLVYEFRQDLQAYLATRRGVPLAGKTLADAIVFNEANADREMPFFGQEVFELAQSLEPGQNDPQPAFDGLTYRQALELGRQSGAESFDKVLADNGLDAIVDFTAPPAWSTDLVYGDRLTYGSSGLVAPAGYPLVNVPAGMVLGLPVGITFFGTAFSEPTLIRLASGFEAVTNVRRDNPPTFAATMPDFSIQGTRLRFPGIDKKRGVTKRLDARRPRHW
jgi:amidase